MPTPTPQEVQAKLAEIRARNAAAASAPPAASPMPAAPVASSTASAPTPDQVRAKLQEIRARNAPAPAPVPAPAPQPIEGPNENQSLFNRLSQKPPEAPLTISTPPPKTAGGFLKNVLKSGKNQLVGFKDLLLHPVDTFNALSQTGAGLVDYAADLAFGEIPGEEKPDYIKQNRMFSDALMENYKQAYGSPQQALDTLYEDPFRVLSDAAAVFTAGGTAASKAGQAGNLPKLAALGSKATGAGEILTKAASLPTETMLWSGKKFVGPVMDAVKAPGAKAAARDLELLESGAPDARVATKAVENGRVVTDKAAKEAVRQGIPEADVALIRAGTESDKSKMIKMLDTREGQLTNKRITDRATDIVGNTFTENLAKPLEKINREAAQELNVVAKGLEGQPVNTIPAVQDLMTKLDASGIKIGKKLIFKGSDFESIKPVQTLLNNVWDRAQRVAKSGDALEAHRLKAYIDEVVSYGKSAEGLSGKAEGILKGFRHSVDKILDENFPKYNEVNTRYADTVRELDNMGAALGRNFRLGDTFADAQAGLAMRRILSNTNSRADILGLLDSMQKTAKKYGVQINDDIITQANFADVLEKMLGSEAPTSFLGQGERFANQVERGIDAATDIARGGIVSGTIKAGKQIIDVTRGINQKNKIKALRALISRGVDGPNLRKIMDEGKQAAASVPFKKIME